MSKPVPPIPSAAAAASSGWLGRGGLVVFAPVAWLLLLDVGTAPLGAALDASWVAVMSKYLAEGTRFGTEALFTYGPLAPLGVHFFDARLFGWVFAGDLVLKGAVVFLGCRLAWDVPGWRRWLLPLALLAGSADWQVLFFFATAGAGWVLVGRTALDRWLTLPALGLLAVLALVKGTLLVLAGLAVAAGALACGWQRGDWRPAAARLAGFAGVFLALWRAVGQRWEDLFAFVRGTLDIADGYSRALSLPPAHPALLPLGLAALALLAGQTVWVAWVAARRGDRAAGPLALLLGGTLFLAWKQGFTRADTHVAAFFNYALVGAAAGPLFFAAVPRRVAAWAHGAGVALAAGLFAAGNEYAGVRLVNTWDTLRIHWAENPAMLRDPRARAAQLKQQIQASRVGSDLPRVRAAVGRETVDLFGYQQGVVIANRLNFTPAPVCQSYQANTPLTQALNRDFLRGSRAPEFVLLRLQPMDNHPPTAESGAALATLLLDYAPVLAENEYLLLRRAVPRAAGPGPHPLPLGRTLAEGESFLHEPLPVPAVGPGEAVWCELDLRESLAGRLLATTYHQIPVDLELEFTDGRTQRRRLVPLTVRTGFLLSPFVASEPDFVHLQAGRGEGLPGVRAVRLWHADPALARQFRPRWGYRLRALPTPAPEVRVAAETLLERRGFEEPGTVLSDYADVAEPPPSRVRSDAAAVERFQLGGTNFVLVHATGEMEWDLAPGTGRVRGRFAMRPNAWEPGRTDGAAFRVEFHPRGQVAPTVLLDRVLNPREVPADRGVQSFDLTLPPADRDRGGRLALRCLPGPGGATNYDFTGWGGVRIE